MNRLYFWIFLLVLAPIAAVVIISALLLFGVQPRFVFASGRAVQSLLQLSGHRAPNGVAVASTAFFWWALIAAGGVAWEKRRQRRAG